MQLPRGCTSALGIIPRISLRCYEGCTWTEGSICTEVQAAAKLTITSISTPRLRFSSFRTAQRLVCDRLTGSRYLYPWSEQRFVTDVVFWGLLVRIVALWYISYVICSSTLSYLDHVLVVSSLHTMWLWFCLCGRLHTEPSRGRVHSVVSNECRIIEFREFVQGVW